MSIPVVVTAHLSTPTIGVDRWPMMLDAPLAWAWAERAKAAGTPLPPLTDGFAADFAGPKQLDVSTHLAQHVDQSRARRIEPDIGNEDVGTWDEQRGDDEEGR